MIDLKNALQNLEDAVAAILKEGATAETIKTMVTKMANLFSDKWKISDDDILTVSKRLETRFYISMDIGSVLEAKDHTPWLNDSRSEIDWHYWENYKRLLSKKGFSPNVITSLDMVTDKIIDHLEDPRKDGSWSRKGLVVGHVQSGKTANYIGIISKAADSGYKVIIVLAGLLNSLRNQTQERIDEGFVGIDSSKQLENKTLQQKRIGVGEYGARTPVPLGKPDYNAFGGGGFWCYNA